MQAAHDLIRRMSGSCAPVLILGESGTGKELAARLLHNQSDCGKGPFVAVNCAAIPAPLLESELFGHVRGSFTGATHDSKGKFEQAEGGTLFLDEVGELPLDLQPKLLRALQEQEITPVGGSVKSVNTRIIAATNRNLEERVEQGLFRSDLYYRLAVLLLTLPALRERSEDIILLAQHFLSRHAEGRNLQFSSEAIELLQNYSWPGNVRELENLIHRLAVLARRELIEKEDLPRHIQICNKSHEPLVVHMPTGGFSLRSIECQAIKQALIASGGNRSKAAEFLEIPRHILAYRIKKFCIDDFDSTPDKLTDSCHSKLPKSNLSV
jgi:two-component system NtrC family response regulator